MAKLFAVLFFMPLIAMTQNLTIAPKVKFLALGDSYTIGQSVPVTDRWPVQLIDSLKKRGLSCYDPQIIATTGWRTDDLKNAIVNAHLTPNYTLVSLLIGVNNYYQGKTVESYKPEFEDLLVTAIKLAGGDTSHVFVVSIPDYGYTPFGQPIQKRVSQGIDAFNDANKTIAAKLGVPYFNITDISRNGLAEPDLVAGDGLHPSGKMYSEWVARILNGANITTVEIPGTDSIGTSVTPDTTSTGSNGNSGTTPTGGSTGSQPTVGSANPPAGTNTVTGLMDERAGIVVYPNPFYDKLNFENLPYNGQILFMRILNSNGNLICSEYIANSSFHLDTSWFAEGIYHYQIFASESIAHQGHVAKLPVR